MLKNKQTNALEYCQVSSSYSKVLISIKRCRSESRETKLFFYKQTFIHIYEEKIGNMTNQNPEYLLKASCIFKYIYTVSITILETLYHYNYYLVHPFR